MEPAVQGVRSRSGCMTCRRKHRKCDEGQPKCQACEVRGLECDYKIPLRWTAVGRVPKIHQENRNSRNTKRGGGRTATTSNGGAHSPLPTSNAAPPASLPPLSQSIRFSQSRQDSPPWTIFDPASSNNAVPPPSQQPRRQTRDAGPSRSSTVLLREERIHSTVHQAPSISSSEALEPTWSVRRHLHSQQFMHHGDQYDVGNEGQSVYGLGENGHSYIEQDDLEVLEDQDSTHIGSPAHGHNELVLEVNSDVPSPANSTPWVIDTTLSNLLFQIFQNPGEKISFTYFFKRVCTCIPAHDGDKNPWRKLALVALSHPVLLHGILSVATAHMHNCGRSNVSVLSSRQGRALHSLQAALNALRAHRDRGGAADESSSNLLLHGGVFSILSATEIALAAVMMQTSSVLMTGAGNVEMHLKCALHFIQDLGYLHRPALSIFSRTLVNRFAMVDVVHAHLRFQRPLASLDFFMYQNNEELDRADPPFREMHGCDQRVLCFLAEIAVLSADLLDGSSTHELVQTKAYTLETEMRIWGHNYHNAMIRGASKSNNTTHSSSSLQSKRPYSSSSAADTFSLDIVSECFYWTAQLLLLRRLFVDRTKSSRVQMVRRHLFQIMDRLEPGCGPDSSLPFPFYMAAREATTLEERDWVRRKHAEMMEVYRDRSREYMMESTEKIWNNATSAEDVPAGDGVLPWCTPRERYIREIDKQATYFMF